MPLDQFFALLRQRTALCVYLLSGHYFHALYVRDVFSEAGGKSLAERSARLHEKCKQHTLFLRQFGQSLAKERTEGTSVKVGIKPRVLLQSTSSKNLLPKSLTRSLSATRSKGRKAVLSRKGNLSDDHLSSKLAFTAISRKEAIGSPNDGILHEVRPLDQVV